jgi:hypothetical protein
MEDGRTTTGALLFDPEELRVLGEFCIELADQWEGK